MLIMLLSSCDIEHSSNGKLDGYWHMTSIDTLSNGNITHLNDRLLFWAFQNKLLEFIDRDGKTQSFLLRFEKNGNTLRIYNPHISRSQSGDVEVTNPATMSPYGINTMEDTLTIEKLGSSAMILRNKTIRINFKRF